MATSSTNHKRPSHDVIAAILDHVVAYHDYAWLFYDYMGIMLSLSHIFFIYDKNV